MPTATPTKASHALRSVIEGNQEQPAFPIKNPDSWSYSTGPPQTAPAAPAAFAVAEPVLGTDRISAPTGPARLQ
jgi:hypothetical protein